MINGHIIAFLFLATVFAAVHHVAVIASLYWYHWWFDILMHIWGGTLVGYGVHTLSTFRSINIKPTLKLVLLALALITISWELFEWGIGLYEPESHWLEVAKDLLFGFVGGLLAHYFFVRYKID